MKSTTELLLEMEEKAAMKEPTSSGLRNSCVWPTMKPFLNGFLTGQVMILHSCVVYWFAKDYTDIAEKIHPRYVARHKEMLNTFRKNLPMGILFETTYTTARFGMFETLTKKVEAANGGRSITLYQEACCGLISGAIAASIYYPFNVHMRGQPIEHKCDYRNLFHPLYSSVRKDGFLALWKDAEPYIAKQMALNMGMLASYGRSLNYLEESIGVGRPEAILGAGVVSAFFALTCSHSCALMVMIKNALRQNAGKKYPYSYIPSLAFQLLKPGGRFKFYSGIFNEFVKFAPYCTMQWIILGKIQKIEESNGI